MSSFHARKAALDMALRHLGPDAEFDDIFHTADRFAAYLDQGRAKHQPRTGANFRWSESMVAELKACSEDPLAFMERLKIQHITKGAIPFEAYTHQKDFIRFAQERRFSHVTQARQMGVSTCLAAFILWSALFEGRERLSLVVSRSMHGSIEILDRIRFMYETLPEHLKIGVTTYNKTRIVFENGNEINAVAASSNTGRGRAVSNLYVDQMAWISHSISREFFEAIYPVMGASPLSRIVLTSAAGDTDGMFYGIMNTIPRNGFERLVLPWYLHPARDTEWASQTRRDLGEMAWKREYECQFIAQPRIERQDRPSF